MAQKKFAVQCNGAAAAAPLPIGYVGCTAAQRARVADILVGPSPVAPVDQAIQVVVGRTTAAPSGGSSVTPAPLDAADVAAVCSGRSADTSDGTGMTINLLQFGLNQRASFRWVA